MWVSTPNGDLKFATNSLERLGIDFDGNVGIGETSPDQLLHLTGDGATIRIEESNGTGDGGGIQFFTNTTAQGTIRSGGSLGNEMAFYSNGGANERMRIDTSGILCVGKTTATSSLRGVQVQADGRVSITCADADGQFPLIFARDGSASAVGSVQTISSGVQYNTTSDERLKENIEYASDSGYSTHLTPDTPLTASKSASLTGKRMACIRTTALSRRS